MNSNDESPAEGTYWIWMVLAGLVAVAALAIGIPNFFRARPTAAMNTCVANLKQIDGAKEQWALENKKGTNTPVTWGNLIGANAYIKNTPTCPQGGSYKINAIGQNPTCSLGGTHMLPL